MLFLFFKQKTAYELRISDWSSDVFSSDLVAILGSHARDAHQDHAMEMARDREIVGGTARLAAQLPERKDGNALQRLWNVQRPFAAEIGREWCRERVC